MSMRALFLGSLARLKDFEGVLAQQQYDVTRAAPTTWTHVKGKVDLTLGVAEGTRAGKVLVDLKTGGFSPSHDDDLRFYALVEAIKVGVPPRRVATHYLESGDLKHEDVTEPMLASAVARVVDAVNRWLELRSGRLVPVAKPSVACRWCPVLETCDLGRQHLAAADDW